MLSHKEHIILYTIYMIRKSQKKLFFLGIPFCIFFFLLNGDGCIFMQIGPEKM